MRRTPLKELPQGSGKKSWWHSEIMSTVGAIKEWGRLPSEFGVCAPEQDLSVMLAYENTVGAMKSYEAFIQEKEAEKLKRKKK